MSLNISRVLHAGYVFECEGTTILFDPLFETPFSRNCHPYPAVEFDHAAIRGLRFDAVFISHYHDDHCSFESLARLDRATPIHLFCVHDEMFELIEALGFVDVRRLRLNTPVPIGGFEIIPRRALDADVDAIFHLRAAGLNVLNVVDAWIDDDTLKLLARDAPWDLVLWPFQTMRELEALTPSRADLAPATVPEEWRPQLRILRPHYVVPSSCQFIFEPWSWLNHAFFPISYRAFGEFVARASPATEVVRLDPSRAVTLDHDGLRSMAPLAWMHPIGPPDVDYEFRPGRVAPAMAEVARHFATLEPAQRRRVERYCAEDILTRFARLEPTDEPYFRTARRWRLEVFTSAGDVRAYHFRAGAAALEPTAAFRDEPEWLTQIAAARLYGALARGESLSSLYIRINDHPFAPARNVDVLEDPLLRCLYTGMFGSYQKAQLAELAGPR